MEKQKKPILVIMAAGMGSRYGGPKQIDPVDEQGNLIIDFSIYDARRAGFAKVVFVIKRENEADFKARIGNRIQEFLDVSYVYQELTDLPEGFAVPRGRQKPYGTGHALLCCAGVVDAPFAVINADDYYGVHAFEEIYRFLTTHTDDDRYRYAMVGYRLEHTLTDNGQVSRGICKTADDASGEASRYLVGIEEHTRIEKRDGAVAYTEDDGKTWIPIPAETIVSMNLWGFSPSIFKELQERFVPFLTENLEKNPLKCEYFLPTVVGDLLREGKATVEILPSQDHWYGVTYKQDKPMVMAAIQSLKDEGRYPQNLWEDERSAGSAG